MKKEIYLIRHSGPFVKLNNLENLKFELQSERMILSVEGEKKAEKLSDLNEFKNVDVIYSSNSNRAIATVKYIAYKNNLKVNVENNLNERVLSMHAIGILAYLKKYCDVKFNNDIFTIIHNGNVLFNKQIGNPEVFKLVFDKENNIETISNIDVNIKT